MRNIKKLRFIVFIHNFTTGLMAKPNAPTLRDLFPDAESVKIYPDDFRDENGDEKKTIIMDEMLDRKRGHFTEKRVAVLFRPGHYKDINFPVGYWTQVLGLGETPDDVRFSGNLGVYALPANTDNHEVGSLDTFWRSAENFVADANFIEHPENPGLYTVPVGSTPDDLRSPTKYYPLPNLTVNGKDTSKYGMLWAVSQAAPIRRIKVKKNLHLALGDNWASGGFAGNVDVGGFLNFGGQQQYIIRNGRVGEHIVGGAWSSVLVGCDHKGWSGDEPSVVTDEKATEHRIEKPYIFIEDDTLFLAIPKVQRHSTGFDHSKLTDAEKVVIDNLKYVQVFSPSDDPRAIQNAASKGVHIILGPGIYHFDNTLDVTVDNQVILGIGMPTIVAPETGKPCIHVLSTTSGVRISGISLEANVLSDADYDGSSLFDWGEKNNSESGNAFNNPGAIHDMFALVGGRNIDRSVKVQTMVRIYSDDIVGDNLWLWRADHTQLAAGEKPNKPDLSEYHLTTYGECMCDTGLEVRGRNVSINGLAVEHTYKDMVKWFGPNGRVNFYQSELPYDVGAAHYKDTTGYRVHKNARDHIAKGAGVYSYFRDFDDVEVLSGIVDHSNSKFENSFTVMLNGYYGIKGVVNEKGPPTLQHGLPNVLLKHHGLEAKDTESSQEESDTN